MPFDFSRTAPSPSDSVYFLGLPVIDTHLPDVLSNIALYILFGLLVRASLLERGWPRATSLLATVLLACGISWLIEFTQMYSISRVSSRGDWLCNIVGAVIGAMFVSAAMLVIAMFQNLSERFSGVWRDDCIKRPSLVLAKVTALVLFLAAVSPLDLTFSPNRVIQSVKSAHWIPFSRTHQLSPYVLTPPERGTFEDHFVSARDQWQLWMDYLWLVTGYGLLATFTCRYLGKHCHVNALTRSGWTLLACLMLSVACFFCEFFIISKPSDVTNIVMAMFGSIVGILASAHLSRLWCACARDAASQIYLKRRAIITVGLVCCVLFVVARECAPFMPNMASASITKQLQIAEVVPMRWYQTTRLPIAIDDLITKFCRYGCLGIVLCLWRKTHGVSDDKQEYLVASTLIAGAVAALEGIQILLPSRVPALTDVLIAFVGTSSGIVSFRILRAFVGGDAIRVSIEERISLEPEQVVYNVEFGSDFPAPIEQSPTPPPAQVHPGEEGEAQDE